MSFGELSERRLSENTALLSKAVRVAETGNYAEALAVLSRCRHASVDVLNARGVCLLRSGNAAAAVKLYRSLTLQPGSTWMKGDLPLIVKTNFATALLMAGLPSGVRDSLHEIGESDHPSVARLRDALRAWERSLSLWQRLHWKCGLAPQVPVPIPFVPGEFTDPMTNPLITPAIPDGSRKVIPPNVVA